MKVHNLQKNDVNNSNSVSQNSTNNYTISSSKKKELESSLSWLFLTNTIKEKTKGKITFNMRTNDKYILILAIIGVLSNILATSFFFSFSAGKGKIFLILDDDSDTYSVTITSELTLMVNILRSITSVTTLALIILLIRHYVLRLKYQKFKQKVSYNATMFNSGNIMYLLIECLVCIIHTPPFVKGIYVDFLTETNNTNRVDVDLFVSSIINLRVYLLFRYYTFYSSWADERAEKICNDCNTMGGISFAIKAELKERPYQVVGYLMMLSILIFGYALRNVEVSFMVNKQSAKFLDWSYVYNGFWCIIITILTVGYGDYYPQTVPGRMIAVIACLWGTFLISLMVVSLTISVEFTPQEQKAYDELKKGEMYFDLKRKALQTIRYSIKLTTYPADRSEIKDDEQKIAYIKIFDKFKQYLNDFRSARKLIINKEHEVSAENILYKLNENVSEEMENLILNSNNQVNTLIDYLNLSQNIQNEIKSYVSKLDNMTKGLSDCID